MAGQSGDRSANGGRLILWYVRKGRMYSYGGVSVVVVQDAPVTSSGPSGITRPRRSWAKIIVAAIILAVVAGAGAWVTPHLVAPPTQPPYPAHAAPPLSPRL